MTSRDPLQEIEDALSFPTSPDFCARVRRRVAAEPMRSRGLTSHDLAIAAAVILSAAVGFMATLSRDMKVAQSGRPVVVNTVKPSETPAVEMTVASAPVVTPRRSGRATPDRTVPTFVTLVPDDQRRALDRLLASLRAGGATVPPLVLDEELNDNGQRVPRALVIEPMKIEPLAGTPGEPIKDPVKDPIKGGMR